MWLGIDALLALGLLAAGGFLFVLLAAVVLSWLYHHA